MSKYGIGQPVLRFEDPRLLRGQGRYINDVNLPGQAHAVFVRSPHAHARIRVDRRRGGEGGARRAGGPIPATTSPPTGSACPRRTCRASGPTASRCSRRSGRRWSPTACAMSAIRWSMVIAETLAQAKDAAELVDDRLRAAALGDDDRGHGEARRAGGMGRVPRQHLQHVERGNKAATDAAIRSAAKVVSRRYVISRVHAQYMEPRGALGDLRRGRGPADPLRRRAVSPSRAQHAGAERLQGAREQDARDRAGCRRRLRHQGLAVCRASPDAVGGAQAAPAGQVDLRAQRGGDGRRARPRQYRRDRAGARQGRQLRRAPARTCWPTSAPMSARTATCCRRSA